MELSELDALIDKLKDVQGDKERLIKEFEEIKLKHSKEVDDLKKGVLVIERTPLVEYKQGYHFDPEFLSQKITSDLHNFSRGHYGASLNNYVKDVVFRNIGMNYSNQAYPTRNGKIVNTIEKVIGSHEIERELKEFYEVKYKDLISSYKETVKNSDKIEANLQKEYENKSAILLKENNEIIESAKKENDRLIDELTKKYDEKIKTIRELHAEEIKRLKPEENLAKLLKDFGYKLEKNIFGGQRLVKITANEIRRK
jgi:hypothetical protein